MRSAKKYILPLLFCSLLMRPALAANQTPWYKNGWKVAAAGWGAGAAGCVTLGTFIHFYYYKRLEKEKKSSIVGLAFRPEDSKKHEVSTVAAPTFLGVGAVFAAIAAVLYRHGCQQK